MMTSIDCHAWPSNVNLNEMFGNGDFRTLLFMLIRNVAKPQTKFRYLAAANFSTFRRLEQLALINCGIEVIEEGVLDAMAGTLYFIDLRGNRLKYVDINMFRSVFESGLEVAMCMSANRLLICTCQTVELDVMIHPILSIFLEMGISCRSPQGFDPASCALHREVPFAKFHTYDKDEFAMRIIRIRMTVADDAIAIETNFRSDIRVIAVSLEAKLERKCSVIVKQPSYTCVFVRKPNDILDLNEIRKGLRDSGFVLITAIPILYRFGARPMHSMTMRCDAVAEKLHHSLIMMTLVAYLLGIIVGFGGGICIAMIKYRMKPNDLNQIDASGAHLSEAYGQIELNIIEPYEDVNYEPFAPRERAVSNGYI